MRTPLLLACLLAGCGVQTIGHPPEMTSIGPAGMARRRS